MRCPKCGRDTYIKKWDSCTACLRDEPPHPVPRIPPPKAEAPPRIYAGFPHECGLCGIAFIGNANALYCSDACRQQNHRIKNQGPYGIAHRKVNAALRTGRLVNPGFCENCRIIENKEDGTYINAHHDDYDKPLDVRWLCGSCHVRTHKGSLIPGEHAWDRRSPRAPLSPIA